MTQKIQTLFIDDIDGSAAEGTVRFGLDGTGYEIDLNTGHAKQLRDALAGTSMLPAGPAGGLNTTEVREWARAQGIEERTAAGCPLTRWPNSRPPPASRAEAFTPARVVAPHSHADVSMWRNSVESF